MRRSSVCCSLNPKLLCSCRSARFARSSGVGCDYKAGVFRFQTWHPTALSKDVQVLCWRDAHVHICSDCSVLWSFLCQQMEFLHLPHPSRWVFSGHRTLNVYFALSNFHSSDSTCLLLHIVWNYLSISSWKSSLRASGPALQARVNTLRLQAAFTDLSAVPVRSQIFETGWWPNQQSNITYQAEKLTSLMSHRYWQDEHVSLPLRKQEGLLEAAFNA